MPEYSQQWTTVRVEVEDGIGWVIFNRPEKRNAMSPTLNREMREVLEALEIEDAVKVLVLTGAGESWTAGMDLKEYFREIDQAPEIVQERVRRDASMWQWKLLRMYAKPTIAMVNGWCFGGGFSPLVACDLAIASETAVFGLSEINWGIPPGNLVSKALADTVGQRKALEYIMTGDTFTGKQAAEMGLVNRAVPLEKLREETIALAAKLAVKNPIALRAAKHGFKRCRELTWEQSEDYLYAKFDQAQLRDPEHGREKGLKQFLDEKSIKPPDSRAIAVEARMEPDVIETEQNRGTKAKLERLLRPRSIALVGASATPGALGESVLINLEEAAYGGDLYLINPKRPMVHGRQCLGAIEELPSGIDCAVLAIPGAAVLASLRACAAKGIRSAIVFSAGFAEAGEGGRAAQQEAARIAEEHDMILLGPNCLGMVNYVDGIPLTFVVTPPQASTNAPGAAILSQSGALAAVIAVNMRRHAIPLTYSVSTGNEASSGVEDYIEHFIGDEKTRVLALVVEQFRQPKRFLELARRARHAGKFIVLLHPGRGNAARASAATHTGAIAGDYQIMRTLVNAAGVILVESLEELVDVAQVLVRCRDLPRGGAAIFTESGAFKALALDLCERIGLALPSLSAQSEEELRKALPAFIPPSNPLDLTAQGLVDPGLYRRTLPAVLQDDAFGSVLLTIILTDPKTTRLKLPPILEAIETLQPRKPILFAAVDEGAPFDFPALDRLRELGVACFPSPERAMRALAHVTRRASNPESHEPTTAVERPTAHLKPGLLTEWESKQFLARIGIAVPQGGMARTRAEAIQLAASIGYPIVLKAQSPLLPHKSDVGGVALAIQNEPDLREKWAELHADVHRARPGLELDGVLVERMSDAGIELIVGARNDPQWGPVLLAGFGGVLAEAINDVCLLPPGVSRAQIVKELLSLRGSALLRGFRGAPARDLAAVADVIQALDSLMRSCPEIAEIDINPLAVYQEGKGATALDALISIRGNNPEER